VNAISDVVCGAAICLICVPFVPACWQPARTGTQTVGIAWKLAIQQKAWQAGQAADMQKGIPDYPEDAQKVNIAAVT
jgi:hypothetical protein